MLEIESTITVLEKRLTKLLENYKLNNTSHFMADSNEAILFETLAGELSKGVIIINDLGQISYCNSAGFKIFHSLKKLSDYKKLIAHFAESEKLFEFEQKIASFINNPKLIHYETELDLILMDGRKERVSVNIKSVQNKSEWNLLLLIPHKENSQSINSTENDDLFLSEIGELEEKAKHLFEFTNKLKKSEEELKETNKRKDKFFNIIAHDLRAPFNSILGLTEILKLESEELSPSEVTDLATRIHNNSENVLEMVEDLLNWARMQTNHIDFNPKNIKIADVVFDTLYLLKQTASLKNIKVETDIDKNISVFADQNMINLVLRNLVSNAIKFTGNNGLIKIFSSAGENTVTIGVEDNGVGIKKENMKKILTIDEHFTNLGTNNEKGTGLGLVLCQEFLSKNKSKLLIESEFGKGSTFSFELPKAK